MYELTARDAEQVIKRARAALQDYFRAHGLKYAVFGKSEGLDSAVIAGLLAGIEGIVPIGVLMPVESDPIAERLGRLVLDHFAIRTLRVDLTREYHAICAKFYESGAIHDQLLALAEDPADESWRQALRMQKGRALGNSRVRLRMITLYHIAQVTKGIVVSTDNLSEYWMGFWTLNGDVGDISPIQFVFKGMEEYSIAKALGVPQAALEIVPTDGLEITLENTDASQLDLPYAELDTVIAALLQNGYDGSTGSGPHRERALGAASGATRIALETVTGIADRMRATDFKRRWPVTFSRESLGLPSINALDIAAGPADPILAP